MKRLVVESPFKANQEYTVEQNIAFARSVCRRAVLMGYAPLASHLFYTQPGILRDEEPSERRLGIDAGLCWSELATEVWFCLRRGEVLSEGMMYAYNRYRMRGVEIKYCIHDPISYDFLKYAEPGEVFP